MRDNFDISISTPVDRRRRYFIFGCGIVLLAGLYLWPYPITQDPAYHAFADSRDLAGIPNFQNVTSNFAFLITGIIGIFVCLTRDVGPMKTAWLVFFAGVTLTTFGSGYYHLDPSDETLMWDRLPMTLGFVGLFIAAVGEYLGIRSQRFLVPAVVVGIASVLAWRFTDDLRLYIWVQALPLVTVPLMILLGTRLFTHSYFLGITVGIYSLAKVFELFDKFVFDAAGGLFGGHAIKHILAAAACLAIAAMLALRKPSKPILLSDAKG